ncbi:lytic transglycosylase domain-containing protein [Burkholderia sp. LS-044]|nr:lytic transglycosylase domain-containing protein [Burkholderia sp. LS-044]
MAGARGLRQVRPIAHRNLVAQVKNLSDPATNVRIGAAIS